MIRYSIPSKPCRRILLTRHPSYSIYYLHADAWYHHAAVFCLTSPLGKIQHDSPSRGIFREEGGGIDSFDLIGSSLQPSVEVVDLIERCGWVKWPPLTPGFQSYYIRNLLGCKPHCGFWEMLVAAACLREAGCSI